MKALCPYFNKPCIKEECEAFTRQAIDTKVGITIESVNADKLVGVVYVGPYCRILRKDLRE